MIEPHDVHRLLSTLPALVFQSRAGDPWTLEYISSASTEITGYAPEELQKPGRWSSLVHPDDRQRVIAAVAQGLPTGGQFEVTYRLLQAQGHEVVVSQRGRGVPSPQGPVWEGLVLEVTEQVHTEQALRVSEAKFSAAFLGSPQSLALSDLATGKFLEVNRGYELVSGRTREETIGRTGTELGIWGNLDERKAMQDLVVKDGQFQDLLLHFVHKSGRVIEAICSGNIIEIEGRSCLLSQMVDITSRLETERKLQASEQKFEAAFRSSPLALSISDLETGEYLDVNSGFASVSGYTREEIMGRTSVEIGLWVDVADRDELVKILKRDGRVRGREIRFFTKAKEQVLTRCSLDLIPWGGKMRLLNVLEDITEQRRAEEARAALDAHLRHLQKLESLGQLAGGIAHDFNNILTGVLANTELAQMSIGEPDRVLHFLGEVKKASGRARGLVAQILAFSRQQVHERHPVDLGPVVTEAANLLVSSLPKTIEIRIAVDDGTPRVLADPTQIHQIVMNLGTNAAHALEGGGQLKIRLQAVSRPQTEALQVPGVRPGSYTRLTVEDTGTGMDAATLKRIFEPFFTTKGPGEGTGLGLSVVHGIVSDHDGILKVDSAPGRGTKVTIDFPELVDWMDEGDKEAGELPLGHQERVLLVDDEAMIATASRELLDRLGYRVESFTEPERALEAFRADPESWDVLVTDLTMPRITGIDLIRQVVLRRSDLPIVLASGYTGSWTPEALASLGVTALVPKPMLASELAVAVRRALDTKSLTLTPE